MGMMSVHHGADRGIFITTSDFSKPAIDLAQRHQITVINGLKLTRLSQGSSSPSDINEPLPNAPFP
jgi:restriction endonuclease Mrr